MSVTLRILKNSLIPVTKNRSLFLRNSRKLCTDKRPQGQADPADVVVIEKKEEVKFKAPKYDPKVLPRAHMSKQHPVTPVDKWIVSYVFRKRYPTRKDVPDSLPEDTYWKARSIFRVRFNIMVGILMSVVAFVVVKHAKYLRSQGKSYAEEMQERDERILRELEARKKAKLEGKNE